MSLGAIPNPSFLLAAVRAREKQRAPEVWAPDARMPLCTYCHARLASKTQAGFDLSPLFRGPPNTDR